MFLFSLLWENGKFCVFCTEEQLSLCQFHQFYILTKISIEIRAFFVYNVFIAVLCTKQQEEVGKYPFPKGENDSLCTL